MNFPQKSSLFIGVLMLWVLFSVTFSFLPEKEKQVQTVKAPEAKSEIFSRENVQQRSEYLAQILVNPNTGTMPGNMRKLELAYAKKLSAESDLKNIQRSAAGQEGSQASNALNWSALGPNNFGGRTRALALDVTNENIILAGGVSGGMWRSEDGGQSWVKTTSNDALQSVTCIVQDTRPGKQNIWYYGTGELIGNSARSPGAPFRGDGMFKSIDGGRSWRPLPSTQVNDPTNFSSPFMYVWDIEINPNSGNDEIIAAIFGGIVRSTDGGSTWATVLGDDRLNLDPGTDLNELASIFYTDIHRAANGIFYATLSGETNQNGELSPLSGVYRSNDGANWSRIPELTLSGSRRTEVGSSLSNPNTVYFLTDRANDHELRRYNAQNQVVLDLSGNLPDGNNEIEAFDSQNSYDLYVAVHPADENVVYVGGTNLYRSTNGFTTNGAIAWIGGYNPDDNGNSIYPGHHPDQHDLVFLPSNPNVMITANDGGLFKTQDNLATDVEYRSLNNGMVTTQFYTVSVSKSPNDNFALGGLQDNGSILTGFNSSNAGVRVIGGDGGFTATTRFGVYYYASFQNGQVYRLTFNDDFALTSFARVDPLGSGGNPSQPILFINPFVLDVFNGNRMYYAGGEFVWRNRNLSQVPSGSQERTFVNWEKLTNTGVANGSVSALEISTEPSNILYYGTSAGQVFRVNDAHSEGYSVTEITDFPGSTRGYVNSIAVNPENANELIVVFSNYQIPSVFYSNNGGVSFTDISGNLEENPDGSGNGPSVRWVKIVPKINGDKEIYLATSIGVFSTSVIDGPNTVWEQEGESTIGNVPVNMIDYRRLDGKIVAATHGNGLYQSQISNVSPDPTSATGTKLVVKNAFPNPFTNFVAINFSVPETGSIRARVYNDQGAVIKTIALGFGFEGDNEIFWDGTNVQGQKVAAGVYMIRLEYLNEIVAQRVILTNY
jgi:hypothetical protein